MRLTLVLLPLLFILNCHQSSVKEVDPVPYRYWESSSVQSNGVRLHYWRTNGEAKPVIIMSHGITDFGLNMSTLASKFEDQYDIIMYDSRGHGFSSKPDGPYDLRTHVEDLVGLVRALDIHKPILIGHSMGGSIVGLTAALYPDLPKAIIMEDPPIEEALERLTGEIADDWKAMVIKFNTMPKADLIRLARTEAHPGWTDYEYDLWAESKRLVVANTIDIIKGDGFGNPREYFRGIVVPALLLKADAEEDLRERHRQAAQYLPNGKLIHFDGAGHLIRNDKPAEMERAIREFLDEIG